MYLLNDCIQIFYKLFSFAYNFLPVLEHLHVPDFKSIAKCRIMIHIFEEFVSLVYNMIISCQIRKIYLIQLTKLQIHEPASFSRAIFYNIQIFRRKKDKIYNSKQFSCLFYRKTIDRNSFCLIFTEVHINLVGKSIFFYKHPNMGFFLSKPDQILIFAAFVGLCRPTDIDRLQNIGFTLCIISIKNIRTLIKVQVKFPIISKILKLYRFNIHNYFITLIS